MKCPNCGEEYEESRNTCLKCGIHLHVDATEGPVPMEEKAGPKQVFSKARYRSCPNCGKLNQGDTKYCAQCGLLLDKPSTCPHCQGSLRSEDRYCTTCGHLVRMEKITNRSGRPVAALLLGLIPGLLSLWGIGHFFAGKFKKGSVFLLLGLLLLLISILFISSFVSLMSLDWWGFALMIVLFGTVWIVLWLYQSLDAYHEAGGE